MSPVLTIDDLAFEVRHSASRKTLGLTVGRMSELVLSARALGVGVIDGCNLTIVFERG